jgi:hypothetical protein
VRDCMEYVTYAVSNLCSPASLTTMT